MRDEPRVVQVRDRAGNEPVVELLRIIELVAAWDPGTLRLGGGVAAAWGETLLDAVRAGLDERLLPDLAAGTTVEQARLGDAAPLLGLAALAN